LTGDDKYREKMNNIRLVTIFIMSCIALGHTADQRARDISDKDYFEIHYSQSGGMKQVIFKRYLFTFIETVDKKSENQLKSASLSSFVEIQKRTEVNKAQNKRLRDWIIKNKISEIKMIPPPEKEQGMAETRYANNLMIYINGQEYNLNHYTLRENPQIALSELFEMAKEFTATNDNN
jgi:hypothetical protein